MAKKQAIKGNLQETHLVKKPLPFVLMKKVPFTLCELKILDTYLSRINIRDPDSRTVTFTKKEFEKLLGVKHIRPEVLNGHILAMHDKKISIPYYDGNKENERIRNITLFSMSECGLNDHGEWEVKLSCSDHAKKYIFNAETSGYLQYVLKHTLKLKSKHSFLLYNYLLNNRFRASWDVQLDELQIDVFRLNLLEAPSYEKFKYFKRDILEKAVKEVNEKTDIEFKYEPVKRGKYVVQIKFMLLKTPEDVPELSDIEQIVLDGFEDSEEGEADSNIQLLSDACKNEFDEYEIGELLQFIVLKDLPDNPNGVWIARYHYLAQKYATLNRYSRTKDIQNRYNYLKKMIEND